MNILLVHLDGKLPNIALMRIAAHHRMLGDTITLRHGEGMPRCALERLTQGAQGE